MSGSRKARIQPRSTDEAVQRWTGDTSLRGVTSSVALGSPYRSMQGTQPTSFLLRLPPSQRWPLAAFMANFVAKEDVIGILPAAGVDEPKRHLWFAYEDRDSVA